MIKQFILTIECEQEFMIDQFVDTLNKQAEVIKDVSPLKINVEKKN